MSLSDGSYHAHGWSFPWREIMWPKNVGANQPPTRERMRSNEIVSKRLLTVREAAQYLGLQEDTIYKKARMRELPSVKVGRALRFDVVALDRYVEQHTIETLD